MFIEVKSNFAAFPDVQEKACLPPSAGESANTRGKALDILLLCLCSFIFLLFYYNILFSLLSLIQSLQDFSTLLKEMNPSPVGVS